MGPRGTTEPAAKGRGRRSRLDLAARLRTLRLPQYSAPQFVTGRETRPGSVLRRLIVMSAVMKTPAGDSHTRRARSPLDLEVKGSMFSNANVLPRIKEWCQLLTMFSILPF